MIILNIISLLGGLALFLYGMRIMRDGLVEKSRYLYSNGDLEQELLYKNGILTKIFTYVTKENYTEDVYSDNMPILRHYYINHRKVSREEWESQVVGG